MGIGGFFKNLFGSSKEKVSEMADKAEEFAGETFEKAKEAAAAIVDKVEDFAESAKEKVEEYIPQAKETVENAFETVKEKANEFTDKAEDFVDIMKESRPAWVSVKTDVWTAPNVEMDNLAYPKTDAAKIIWEASVKIEGIYSLVFTGKAENIIVFGLSG